MSLPEAAAAAAVAAVFSAMMPPGSAAASETVQGALSSQQAPVLWLLFSVVLFLAGQQLGFQRGLQAGERNIVVNVPPPQPTRARAATDKEALQPVGEDAAALIASLPHTALSTCCTSFAALAKVPTDALSAGDFLKACHEFDEVLAAMGASMAIARKDFSNNIKKLSKAEGGSSSDTLFGLLSEEKSGGMHKAGGKLKDPSAAIAALWIRRSLKFNGAIFHGILASKDSASSSSALSSASKLAYHDVLEPFHGWKLRGVFSFALKALPSRDDFFSRLAHDIVDPAERSEILYQQMTSLSDSIEALAAAMEVAQRDLGLEDESKV